MSYLWGIDLGGTKIEAAVIDPADIDQPICRMRVPTESKKGYGHIRSQIALLCTMISRETGFPIPQRIGMGTPGTIDPPTGKLKNSNTQCMNGQMLGVDLKADTGVDFILANDANCFALAEAQFGVGRGFPTVFGVILGTGVGGGIVVNGHILPGCHGIAGEWGQIVLDRNGPVSAYGDNGPCGTIEAMIAGPSLERFYAERTGQKRKLKEITERATAGTDVDALATIHHLTDNFAKSIAMVIDILDPHVIILGGGVGNIDALYTDETREKITASIFNPRFEAKLLRPTLGDSAGVFGAAMLLAD